VESPEPPQVHMTDRGRAIPAPRPFVSLHHVHMLTHMHAHMHIHTHAQHLLFIGEQVKSKPRGVDAGNSPESPKAQRKPLPSETMGHPVSNPIPIRGGLHFSLLPATAGSHHSPTLSFLDHKSKNRNSSLRISRGKGEGEMAATKKLANKRWALVWSCCETNFFFYNSLSLFNPFFRIILPLFSFFPLAFLLPTLCRSPSLLSPLSFSLKVIFRRSGSSVSCRLRRGRRDGQAHLLQCKAWHQCAK